ncbi:MAG: AMP-binding protein [Candidatus Planktophila sp.]
MEISPNSKNPSRPVIAVDPALPIGDVMNLLAKALAHQGPALNFTQEVIENVASEICLIVETTGSSGTKKSVALTSAALLASTRAALDFLQARPGQTWALLLPIHHIAGINVLIRSLELGTTPVDLRNAAEYPATDFSAVVPTQIYRALNGDQKLLSHLKAAKFVLVGGARIQEDLLVQALDAGISIIRTYGMSETSGGCIYEGTPLNGVKVKISEEGLIQISGSILASAYLNHKNLWSQQFDGTWFTTSDLGRIDDDGTVEVLGRADDVYVTGGEKVSLVEVVETLEKTFPLQQWSAVAVADAQWGQRLVIAVVGADHPTLDQIGVHISKVIGEFAKPKQLLTYAQMPTIGIGKIDTLSIVKRAKDEFHG